MAYDKEIPAWLLQNRTAGLCQCGCAGVKKKTNFLEKTINDIAGVLKESVFSETLAAERGMLQNIDPRVKLLTVTFLLVIIAFIRHIPPLVGLYLFTLMLAFFSRVPLLFFVKRVWLFIPLFTGLIALPSIFNFIRPGDPLVTLVSFAHPLQLGLIHLPAAIAITRQGLAGAGLIVLRVGVSVSLIVLLTITSRWADILKAMRVFLIPRIFIMVMEMTYRYIYLLLTVITDMYTARKSRTLGEGNIKENRNFISSGIGNVFGKAYYLSEEIHDAMISRGYTGDARTINKFRLTAQDIVWVVLMLIIGILFWGGDQILGR